MMIRTALFTAPALLALACFGAACGDDEGGSERDKAAVLADLTKELEAEKTGNADLYLQYVTDNWLKTVVGATRDEVKQDPSTFQDDNPPGGGDISVSGNKATVEVIFATNDRGKFDFGSKADLVKQDGRWKLDALHVTSVAKAPSGAKSVDLELQDHVFKFKPEEMTSNRPIVFKTKNTGKQPHILVMFKVPVGLTVEELIAAQDLPTGVEHVGGAFLFAPGDKADVAIMEKLAPGRYVMICFLDDTVDRAKGPHFAQGMQADFTVK